MNFPEYIAFIPVRGESKSIPLKNIANIAGKPLLYWVAKAAQECPEIEEIFISTDNERIAETALNLGFSKLNVVGRSPESATDTAPTELVVFEFANSYSFKNMILIQATSPLLTSNDLLRGIRHFQNSGFDSLLSLVRQKRFLWEDYSGLVKPLNYDPIMRPTRQEFKGHLIENGAFYIFSREGFLKHRCRLFGKIGWVEMDPVTYFEVDEPSDLVIVEQLLLNKLNHREHRDIY
jgi:N-acylneuraminate cytidylyltransferase